MSMSAESCSVFTCSHSSMWIGWERRRVLDSLGVIKCSLKCIYSCHKYLYFHHHSSVCAPCCNIWYSGCFPTVAREEVGSLIGAVVLSCRLRARGVSHHHQDETLWHLSMKVPECLAAQHRWVCLYFTVKEVCRALWSEWDFLFFFFFMLILAKGLRSCR